MNARSARSRYLLLSALLFVALSASRCRCGGCACHENSKIALVDVWGEGRIVDGQPPNQLITGFPDAENINHKNQKISNGPDAGQSIPNLLPVDDYDNPKFPLKDRTVRTLTLMGAPITLGTAREMMRVLDVSGGRVLLYAPDAEHQQNFETAASEVAGWQLVTREPSQLDAPYSDITITPVLVYSQFNLKKDEL